jgi:glyoxylase-like metal-dependent hydrolase (beta-lactamase superfamily II)
MLYSSNAYLVLGDWSAIEDVNTLIDVGNDANLIDKIVNAPTGVGKRAIDQVIITHGHFDHAGILPRIREYFDPVVYAFSPYLMPDVLLQDGQALNIGDRRFEVIYTPGHSDDSICLYCPTEGVLFVGDTPVTVCDTPHVYDERFIQVLERLCGKDVRSIYLGHGEPILDAQAVLLASLTKVRLMKNLG